jgi:nucleoside-diphosphate-sugar epimerase
MRALIAGASGFVGTRLAHALVDEVAVRGLVRSRGGRAA